MSTMKTCSRCGRNLHISRFRASSQTPDKLAYECNACHSAYNRKQRGGLKKLELVLPEDLREQVEALLESEGETPAEFVERLVRWELARRQQ